ncbi:MAG: hypothetical protein QOD83_2285, partial [Solirubrobacteraceae bacterium]|nr:hypothetical protein [Solirubrobacteraceae bacterium]
MLLLGSANRDLRRFADAQDFDIDRADAGALTSWLASGERVADNLLELLRLGEP